MYTNIEALTVTPQTTLRDALDRLNSSAQGILLLLDQTGGLRRTVTDGDIRRLLLAGAGMDATLAQLPVRAPVTTPEGTDGPAALTRMSQAGIDQLPVLDPAGRPVGIFRRRDLDEPVLLSTPHLSEFEKHYVEEAFSTNWIAPLGPNVDGFERELGSRVGVSHVAAVSSGTAAIHLAMRLLEVGPGDTVFCSSLTFVATANPIVYQGATPVFIDSEPESWNMSPAALGRALDEAARRKALPKAVIVVDLYGQSADIDPIAELCRRYEVPLVEDAAESLGATYKGRASGSFGLLSIFSFNGNKIITTSGGGALASNDRQLVERARFLSTQARDPAPHYQHSTLGYNYRMSNVLAGIGRGQLRVLDQRVAARRAVFQRYRDGLADIPAIHWMPEASFGRSNRWLSVFTIDPRQSDRMPADVLAQLGHRRIEARPVWKPLHLQPVFAGCSYHSHTPDASFSDAAFAFGVCLPSGSNMTEGQQDRVIGALRATFLRKAA